MRGIDVVIRPVETLAMAITSVRWVIRRFERDGVRYVVFAWDTMPRGASGSAGRMASSEVVKVLVGVCGVVLLSLGDGFSKGGLDRGWRLICVVAV